MQYRMHFVNSVRWTHNNSESEAFADKVIFSVQETRGDNWKTVMDVALQNPKY